MKIKNVQFSDVRKALSSLKNTEDFFCGQVRDGIHIEYRPKYPNRTPADFNVWIPTTVKEPIKMYGNLGAVIGTIKEYTSFFSLIEDLKSMEAI